MADNVEICVVGDEPESGTSMHMVKESESKITLTSNIESNQVDHIQATGMDTDYKICARDAETMNEVATEPADKRQTPIMPTMDDEGSLPVEKLAAKQIAGAQDGVSEAADRGNKKDEASETPILADGATAQTGEDSGGHEKQPKERHWYEQPWAEVPDPQEDTLQATDPSRPLIAPKDVKKSLTDFIQRSLVPYKFAYSETLKHPPNPGLHIRGLGQLECHFHLRMLSP